MGFTELETTSDGYLVDAADWTEEIAKEIAVSEGIEELTERHWDLINYLRDEFINNNENQPSERDIIKEMSEKWGEKIAAKDLYALFPRQPSK